VRTRLTAGFALILLVVVAVFLVARSLTTEDALREDVRDRLSEEARLLALVVAERVDAGAVPSVEELRAWAGERRQVQLTLPDGDVLTTERPDEVDGDPLRGAATLGGATVVVSAPAALAEDEAADLASSRYLVAAVLVLVGSAAGALLVRREVAPLVAVASAARALRRGRLSLRLPRGGSAEVRDVVEALAGAAQQRSDLLRRDRDLALRASHEVRTPLTALRMDLEELQLRDDLPAGVRTDVERCAATVLDVDRAVAQVLAEVRTPPVVEAGQVALADVVAVAAAAWSDALALSGAEAEVRVSGDLAAAVTAGPLEELLDELLQAVSGADRGRVRLEVHGGADHVRLVVAVPDGSPTDQRALGRARGLVEVLGGRCTLAPGAGAGGAGLQVVVPRR